jgi:FHS family L-fucose permease-like MFS transporter
VAEASPLSALTSLWAVLGAGAIFLYVGAEVSIGSVLINFLEQPNILAISAEQAGKLLSFYWLGAMLGRFLGSGALAKFKPGPLLTGVAVVAALLCLLVSQSQGEVAADAAIAIGLFNSIMFPTIFTLTLERSSASAAPACRC